MTDMVSLSEIELGIILKAIKLRLAVIINSHHLGPSAEEVILLNKIESELRVRSKYPVQDED